MLTVRPRSNAVNVYDSVPGVWPGVVQIVTVRPAERDLHPVGRNDVTLGRHRLVAVRIFLDSLPVRCPHDDTRAVFLLDDFGAADVIGVGVRDDEVLDLLRIEPQLLHPADDQFL
jgi:hypothetical protein